MLNVSLYETNVNKFPDNFLKQCSYEYARICHMIFSYLPNISMVFSLNKDASKLPGSISITSEEPVNKSIFPNLVTFGKDEIKEEHDSSKF